MAKRTASSDLNHLNWDQEDETEEAGTFTRAPETELKSRVIKTAKRRSLGGQGGENSGAFRAFAGFGKTAPPPTSTAFSFLSNLPAKTNGVSSVSTTPTAEKNSSDGLEEYYSKLKGLNESVAKFVKNHVETNPFINLQPVFKDYERYFNDLEKLRDSLQAKVSEGSGGKEEVTATAATTTTKTTTTTTTPSGFSFKPPTSNPPVETPKTTTQPQFSFGFSSSNSVFSPAKPTNTGFTFGSTTETTKTTTSGFSFGATTTSSTPFSFGSKPPENNEEENKEEEDAEPPKPDFTPVVEEGHIFTTRCKVFVKKDGNFSDRGVGNLFLKPVPSSEKVQLIVRADTSLGNLLLNLILSASLPVQRVGKKDVILVCVPTPDAQPPPVPVLLRVKSPEEADQLLETLEKHKK